MCKLGDLKKTPAPSLGVFKEKCFLTLPLLSGSKRDLLKTLSLPKE